MVQRAAATSGWIFCALLVVFCAPVNGFAQDPPPPSGAEPPPSAAVEAQPSGDAASLDDLLPVETPECGDDPHSSLGAPCRADPNPSRVPMPRPVSADLEPIREKGKIGVGIGAAFRMNLDDPDRSQLIPTSLSAKYMLTGHISLQATAQLTPFDIGADSPLLSGSCNASASYADETGSYPGATRTCEWHPGFTLDALWELPTLAVFGTTAFGWAVGLGVGAEQRPLKWQASFVTVAGQPQPPPDPLPSYVAAMVGPVVSFEVLFLSVGIDWVIELRPLVLASQRSLGYTLNEIPCLANPLEIRDEYGNVHHVYTDIGEPGYPESYLEGSGSFIASPEESYRRSLVEPDPSWPICSTSGVPQDRTLQLQPLHVSTHLRFYF